MAHLFDHPLYSRLILTGILPFATLLYLYLRIYLILRRRRKAHQEGTAAVEEEFEMMQQAQQSTGRPFTLAQTSR